MDAHYGCKIALALNDQRSKRVIACSRQLTRWPAIGHSCAMIRIALLLLSLVVAFSETVPAADRSLVAEGDYVAQKNDGIKSLAHWKLWHLRSGEYEVVESSVATNAPITQIFRFDAQFLPIGYVLNLGQNSRVADYSPMSISCKYETQELRCDIEYTGTKSTKSVPAKQPYVFAPEEFYGLDFAWFLTEVVQLAERSKAKETVVNVYIMTDTETERLALKPDTPISLFSRGRRLCCAEE